MQPMSFRFTWPEFDAAFISKASKELENALNRGKKPSNICDLIRVKELHMGTQPPDLDILEIGEVSMDRFRGIFKLAYSGDGYLVLETKVQVKSGYNVALFLSLCCFISIICVISVLYHLCYFCFISVWFFL